MLDNDPEEYPDSAALRNFLAKRSDSLRDKRLVVMGFRAPYYLDTTEISKLTAYFGVYSKTAPFLETAARALFREFSPVGTLPVSVAGVNYDLIKQLEPSPNQIIGLSPTGPAQDASGSRASIQVGSRIPVETGVILDRNGRPVPDGTLVEFRLRYPAEGLELAPKVETTSGGKARTTVVLDRAGELWLNVQSGEAKESARIVLKVGGDTPGSIATVLPSPTVAADPDRGAGADHHAHGGAFSRAYRDTHAGAATAAGSATRAAAGFPVRSAGRGGIQRHGVRLVPTPEGSCRASKAQPARPGDRRRALGHHRRLDRLPALFAGLAAGRDADTGRRDDLGGGSRDADGRFVVVSVERPAGLATRASPARRPWSAIAPP